MVVEQVAAITLPRKMRRIEFQLVNSNLGAYTLQGCRKDNWKRPRNLKTLLLSPWQDAKFSSKSKEWNQFRFFRVVFTSGIMK